MARIAVVSMSDGRDFVHRDVRDFIDQSEARLAKFLSGAGHEVVRAEHSVDSNVAAVRMGRQLNAAGADLTIFHYAVWAFPHFTMLTAGEIDGPLVLLGSIDPVQPGMVGMLAAAGALDQIGRAHQRLWGEVDDSLLAAITAAATAAAAVRSLRGKTFGRVGGRPMGMNTAVANTDSWVRAFGVDVEEIDQWELVLRSEKADAAEARRGREWFEQLATVHYDGHRLTPDLLERQLRSYLAMCDLIEDLHLDFCGIKGQPELTNNYATMDVTEALLNDPYDWRGPKPTTVCATESDMDGALTMQLLRSLSGGQPVLFADVRHYHADRGIWDLANSGQHATWFAERSDDAAENLRRVHLYPEVFFFPAGGASVSFIAAPGDMTFARLSRQDGQYRLQATRGTFERYDDQTNELLARQSTFEWPHAFARLDAPTQNFLGRFGANHIHAVSGDHLGTLRRIAELLSLSFDDLTQ